MKTLFYAGLIGLAFSLHATADELQHCEAFSPSLAELALERVTGDGPKQARVEVQGKVARDIYAEMLDIPEVDASAGVSEEDLKKAKFFAKQGKSLLCFKQIINGESCGYYTCNVAFSNIRTGTAK
jgi:hypothetical protein